MTIFFMIIATAFNAVSGYAYTLKYQRSRKGMDMAGAISFYLLAAAFLVMTFI